MSTPQTRWKVKKLGAGRWLVLSPDCPPADHLCWRWLLGKPKCTIRATLPEAHTDAAKRYRLDAYDEWVLREGVRRGRYTTSDLGRDPWKP